MVTANEMHAFDVLYPTMDIICTPKIIKTSEVYNEKRD